MNVSSALNSISSSSVNDKKQTSSSDTKTDIFKDLLNKVKSNKNDNSSVSDKKTTDKADKTEQNSSKDDSKTNKTDKTDKNDKPENTNESKPSKSEQSQDTVSKTVTENVSNVDIAMLVVVNNGNFANNDNLGVEIGEVSPNQTVDLSANTQLNSKSISVDELTQTVQNQGAQVNTENNEAFKTEVSQKSNSNEVLQNVNTNEEVQKDIKPENKAVSELKNDNFEVKSDKQTDIVKDNISDSKVSKTEVNTNEVKPETVKEVSQNTEKENVNKTNFELKDDTKSQIQDLNMKTDFSQKVNVKVGDAVVDTKAADFDKQLAEEVVFKASNGKNEFEVELSPRDLGKITIKIQLNEGHATVSMLCSNPKTMSLLTENAGSIGAIIQNNTGNQTVVTVHEEKNLYDQQQGQNQNNNNGSQEQNQQNRRQSQNQHEDTNFMQKLRLGLVDISGNYTF